MAHSCYRWICGKNLNSFSSLQSRLNTIPVHPEDFTVLGKTPVIIHHSLIETHQLFHVSASLLSSQTNRPLGDLNSEKLQAVLAGAKKLFNS